VSSIYRDRTLPALEATGLLAAPRQVHGRSQV